MHTGLPTHTHPHTHAHARQNVGAFNPGSQILDETYFLYCSVRAGAEEKNKRGQGGGIEKKGQGLNVSRAARITPRLIRAHLETCRTITHGFTV